MSNNKSKINLRTTKASRLEKTKAKEAAEKTASDLNEKSEKEASKADTQIKRINELSKMARGTWFSLLGYLAFVGVTLLAVQDADFFVSTRKTQLPIVNIPIPTASFFIFGPILGTALFVYLHLYLIRLWDALSHAPAKIGDVTLSEAVMPWLINDFGLWLRNDGAFKKRPMDWLSHLVTFLLVFIAAPFVMGYFWVRHWPSHDLWISYGLAFLFSLTLIISLASFLTARQRLRFKIDYQTGRHYIVVIPFICFISLTLVTSFLKTEGSEWHQKEKEARSNTETPHDETKLLSYWFWHMGLAQADMAEAELIEKPANWLSYADQRSVFRKSFCKSEGLTPLECGPIPTTGQTPSKAQDAARLKWAQKYILEETDRIGFFTKLDQNFETGWENAHKSLTSALPKLNLSKRDLRNANLSQAFFANADLRGAKMQGAILSGAEMQGANLSGAEMQGAYLSGAEMQRADLSRAKLQGADLSRAKLQGADLRDAKLQDAKLRFAKLQGADLRRANLQGADLGVAKLQGADLRDAKLQGAYLRGAILQDAKLGGANLQDANLRVANLRGANLRGANLQGANLRGANLQGANLGGAELQGANLGSANLQGANLGGAELKGANLREAKLQGAKLRFAKLQGVNLRFAKLQGVNLHDAKLQGADLRDAKLQGADLRDAKLQGADLRSATLQDANLRGANLREADLRGADLRGAKLGGADLWGAKLGGATLRGANLRGANLKSVEWAKATLHFPAHSTDLRVSSGLTQDMLKNVIGNRDTLLFATEGHSLHVWSCWLPDNLPSNLDQLLEQSSGTETNEELRAKWVCSDNTPRVPTGTTKPLDAE